MLLGFQKQFVDKILSGEKRQTIRATRKYPIKVNDKLQLYTGLRTKYCKKIMDAICIEKYNLELHYDGRMLLDNYLLGFEEKNILAVIDGFENFSLMRDWFIKNHNLEKKVFYGNIIRWR